MEPQAIRIRIMSNNINLQKYKHILNQKYLAVTEELVRNWGLSLDFLASPTLKPTLPRPTANHQPSDLLTPKQAADVLGLSVKTLANWRVSGKPDLIYSPIGRRIRYQYSD